MSETLRPQFFITRQNGAFVPLIALDELPPILYLRDVSRTLTPAETQGMQSVGAVVSRNQYYFVEGFVPQNSQSIGFPYSNTTLFPTRSLTPGSPSTAQPWQHPNNHRTWLRNAHGHGSNGEQAGEIITNSHSVIPSPPNAPILAVRMSLGKKEYCSYWLRHGECDYAQQGCIYKHEMPHDRATLERLGLRDLPRWYREKHNLGSLLGSNGTITGSRNIQLDKSWRPEAQDFGQRAGSREAQLQQNGNGMQKSGVLEVGDITREYELPAPPPTATQARQNLQQRFGPRIQPSKSPFKTPTKPRDASNNAKPALEHSDLLPDFPTLTPSPTTRAATNGVSHAQSPVNQNPNVNGDVNGNHIRTFQSPPPTPRHPRLFQGSPTTPTPTPSNRSLRAQQLESSYDSSASARNGIGPMMKNGNGRVLEELDEDDLND